MAEYTTMSLNPYCSWIYYRRLKSSLFYDSKIVLILIAAGYIIGEMEQTMKVLRGLVLILIAAGYIIGVFLVHQLRNGSATS